MSVAKIDRSLIVLSEDEKWIPGFVGYYSITKNGQVYSYVFGDKREKRANNKTHRYASVTLGNKNRWYIHELVLLTYIGPRPDGYVACHFNDEPRDNRLENLRWDTIKNNIKDAMRNNPGFGKWNQKYQYPYKKICDVCGNEFFVNNDEEIRQKNQCCRECTNKKRADIGKISGIKRKGIPLSEEHRIKLKGRVFSQEHRERIGKAHSGHRQALATFIRVKNQITNEVKTGQQGSLCFELDIDQSTLVKQGKTKGWILIDRVKKSDLNRFKDIFPEYIHLIKEQE